MRPMMWSLLALPALTLAALVVRERRDVDKEWANWRQDLEMRVAGRGR
ncbi:hypothetical protein GURKE_00860 [Brevundimonas phage vB_BpoS-Gurke]|uniref:Uncharacterized protein n=1 Tax=Brevundimonas phage vB_BpoS-Gurke TaxID=2948599 RepID=A0A9E7ST95_9CAUD|nr:hypothetical protein GURKE_00860 [Brevundimonas phage vB_BpoS-Gurke]